jgi:ribosomal protein S27E
MDLKLKICDCPYCNYFKELPEGTVLLYPKDKKDIELAEFIIIECNECKLPVVIYGEHVMEITREAYGRILFRCKILFGADAMLKEKHTKIHDHFSIHKIGRF